jgi:hypothetical protein
LNIVNGTVSSSSPSSDMVLKKLGGPPTLIVSIWNGQVRSIGLLLMCVRHKWLVVKGTLLMGVIPSSLLDQNVVKVDHNVALWRVNKVLMRLDSHRWVMLA